VQRSAVAFGVKHMDAAKAKWKALASCRGLVQEVPTSWPTTIQKNQSQPASLPSNQYITRFGFRSQAANASHASWRRSCTIEIERRSGGRASCVKAVIQETIGTARPGSRIGATLPPTILA
jgi:hypothetical protein